MNMKNTNNTDIRNKRFENYINNVQKTIMNNVNRKMRNIDEKILKRFYQTNLSKTDRQILGKDFATKLYYKKIEERTKIEEKKNDGYSYSDTDDLFGDNPTRNNSKQNKNENNTTKAKVIFESEETAYFWFENRVKRKKTKDIYESLLFLDKEEMIKHQNNPLELYRYIRTKHSRGNILEVVNQIL